MGRKQAKFTTCIKLCMELYCRQFDFVCEPIKALCITLNRKRAEICLMGGITVFLCKGQVMVGELCMCEDKVWEGETARPEE